MITVPLVVASCQWTVWLTCQYTVSHSLKPSDEIPRAKKKKKKKKNVRKACAWCIHGVAKTIKKHFFIVFETGKNKVPKTWCIWFPESDRWKKPWWDGSCQPVTTFATAECGVVAVLDGLVCHCLVLPHLNWFLEYCCWVLHPLVVYGLYRTNH